jgi:hypothetical protein
MLALGTMKVLLLEAFLSQFRLYLIRGRRGAAGETAFAGRG